MQKLSVAIKNFNDRVKLMNQTGSKQLALSAEEARNLHADIFTLLANLAEQQTNTTTVAVTPTGLDGGGF